MIDALEKSKKRLPLWLNDRAKFYSDCHRKRSKRASVSSRCGTVEELDLSFNKKINTGKLLELLSRGSKSVEHDALVILDEEPKEVFSRSSSCGCTPLHFAVLFHTFNHTLIQLILRFDTDGLTLGTKNILGDTPLHIAAAVGAPSQTIAILNPNNSKIGQNLFRYSPLEVACLRMLNLGRRSDQKYLPALRPADLFPNKQVDPALRIIRRQPHYRRNVTSTKQFVCDLLVRYQSAGAEELEKEPPILKILQQNFLGEVGMTMLESFPWKDFNEENYPWALRDICRFFSDPFTSMPTPVRHRYVKWMTSIVRQSPTSLEIQDETGRLPLHYLLQYHNTKDSLHELSFSGLIQEMVRLYPHSIQTPDPITLLQPALLAATGLLPMEISFILLRLHPGIVNEQLS